MEDNLIERQPQWKTTPMEDNIKEALQEADDISLPSLKILYWAWPSSAPACLSILLKIAWNDEKIILNWIKNFVCTNQSSYSHRSELIYEIVELIFICFE